MKVKNKILTAMVFGTILSGLIIPNKANAALQSNGGTPAKKDLSTWMLQIRQMQELGGTLGRTDSVDTTNLTSGATDLDIHMEKNTEYGAMAILSASAYGNPNKINDGETTTGNSTGIVMHINNEWVAAGKLTNLENFTTANERYKNVYNTSYVAKIGDAIVETEGWHGSKGSVWITNTGNAGVLRGYFGSIFSYVGNGKGNGNSDVAYCRENHYSRAVIVVGTGL